MRKSNSYIVSILLSLLFLPVLGQITYTNVLPPSIGELVTRSAAKVTIRASRDKADGILLVLYDGEAGRVRPLLILPDGNGKCVDLSRCRLFKTGVSTTTVDRALYDEISMAVRQDTWTTDSLNGLEPYSGYVFVWGGGTLHTTEVTTDKCRELVTVLQDLAGDDILLTSGLDNLRHRLFDGAVDAGAMRWIELGRVGKWGISFSIPIRRSTWMTRARFCFASSLPRSVQARTNTCKSCRCSKMRHRMASSGTGL